MSNMGPGRPPVAQAAKRGWTVSVTGADPHGLDGDSVACGGD